MIQIMKRLHTVHKYCMALFLVSVVGILGGCSLAELGISDDTQATKPAPVTDTQPQQPKNPITGQAHAAWEAGNMNEAERLYGMGMRQEKISGDELALALERLTRSALANKHPYTALDALERWRQHVPGVELSWMWLSLWRSAVTSMSDLDLNRLLQSTWNDAVSPAVLRVIAGEMAFLQESVDSQSLALQLNELYNVALPEEQRLMEYGLLADIINVPPQALERLVSFTDVSQDVFPWTIVLLEQARRAKRSNLPEADTLFTRLDKPELFATAGVVEVARQGQANYTDVFVKDTSHSMATTSSSMVDPSPMMLSSGCYTMILPMSGPYATIGAKMAQGAAVAQQELAKSGVQAEVLLINTESSNWLDQLDNLPEHCVTVGGPMRPDGYAQVKARGLTQERALFTFLSKLDEGDEGSVAWRFFSSPEDQITAVLSFARQVGVAEYASFYPDDMFGQRMTGLFSQAVESSGARMGPMVSYLPSDQAAWNDTVRSFVGTTMIDEIPVPSTSFGAVFLPDSWSASELLIPYLFFQGEDRLLLLGTALWEQGLADKVDYAVNNFRLAVFPGAWNSATPTAAATRLINGLNLGQTVETTADFWTGIGYDFVRFASALDAKPGWDPASINSKLARMQSFDWSMAPLRWENGRAEQALFLFTPSENGFTMADVALFRQRLERVREQHDKRVEAAKEEAKKKKQVKE